MTSSVSKTSILILLALKCPSTKYDRVNTLFQHDFGEFEKWNRALRSRALPLRCLRRGCSLVTVSPGAMEPGESVLLTSVPASGRGENISVCYGFPAYLETRAPASDNNMYAAKMQIKISPVRPQHKGIFL